MQVIIGNSVIPMDPGTSLPLVLRSPMFSTSDNKIPGSYIFNSSFPASDALCKEFAQAQRIQRHGRVTAELPYRITAGSLRFSGNCIVTQYESNQFEIAFKVDNGDFAAKLSGKTLKDLALGGDQMIWLNPYAAVTNTAHLVMVAVFDVPFERQWMLLVPFKIIDNTNSFHSNIGIYNVPVTGPYTVKATLNTTDCQGTACFQVVKNSTLSVIGSTPLQKGSNSIELQFQFVQNEDYQFYVNVESAYNPSVNKHIVSVIIHQGYILEVKQGNSYIVDVVNGNQDTFDFTVFPILNSEFLANFPEDAFMLDNLSIKTIYSLYFPVQNYWKNGDFPFYLTGNTEDETIICGNLFTPFVYLNTLLKKIISEAGYTLINNPFQNEFSGAVLFNAFAENTFNPLSPTIVPIKPTFNLSDHVPAIPQTDFLNWVSFLIGYFPVIDNNALTVAFIDCKNIQTISPSNPAVPFPGILLATPKITIEPEYKGIKLELKQAGSDKYLNSIKPLHSKLVYKGEIEEFHQFPLTGNLVNDMYLVTRLNEYYVFQYNPETYALNWCFYSKKFPLIYSEGTEPFLQIETELCPILSARVLDETLCAPEYRIWSLPKTQQAGILEGFPDSLSAEYGFQVLYYKGMSLDNTGQPYPLGTSRLADYSGNPLFFPDLNADSLFKNRYKGFLCWLAYETKPATFKAILTTAQLKQIKFNQIYSGNGFHFLVKELRVNMQVDGLSVAEMDIYTC